MVKDVKRVALVTGANGAIGQAICELIGQDPAWLIVLLCRNESKARGTLSTLKSRTGHDGFEYRICDLSDPKAIAELARNWNGPLHALVNNAAITPRKREENSSGLEMQFSVNVMGYFHMMEAFRKILAQSAKSVIVNVASYWAGDLDLDDLQFKKRSYNNNTAYRQSKQANRMLTAALTEKYRKDGIALYSCHPGDVNSKLSNSLGFGGSASAADGADTPAWLAMGGAGFDTTSGYFNRRRQVSCEFSRDTDSVERLYQICSSLAKKS